MDLKNKYGSTCLITGASAGIGKAYAYKFAELGLDLVLVARREKELQDIKQQLESAFNVQVHVCPVDLSDEGASRKVREFTNSNDLEVSILINNAGFGTYAKFEDCALEREVDSIKVNCIAPVELSHLYLTSMLEKGKGAIINVSSVISFLPGAVFSVYKATKSFDLLFSESLHEEVKDRGIDVLAVLPTLTKTEFQVVSGLKSKKSLMERTPEQVVSSTLGALGKKAVVVDGLLANITVFLPRLLPRFLVRKIVRMAMPAPS